MIIRHYLSRKNGVWQRKTIGTYRSECGTRVRVHYSTYGLTKKATFDEAAYEDIVDQTILEMQFKQ